MQIIKNIISNLIAVNQVDELKGLKVGKSIVIGGVFLSIALTASKVEASSSLTVTIPNGYASISVEDLSVQSTAGPVRWTRKWDGQEWKFNPQWESLSQSWKNMTGSLVGSSAARDSGCYVWVDEDWQPSKGSVIVGGVPVGKMSGLRSTPFNRTMGDKVAEYPVATRVNVDYASLCGGGAVSLPVQDFEGFRRGSELYLGNSNRFMFNSRAFLEKASSRGVFVGSSGGSSSGSSAISAGTIPLDPKPVEKGFRWVHKEGNWIEYNAQGLVLSYGDKNGNTIWLTRDSEGRLAGAVDANGRVAFSLHYSGELLSEVRDYPITGNAQDLPSRSVKYQYDEANRLTAVTDVRGNITRYEYDGGNRIVKITDPEGRVEQIKYTGDLVTQRIAPDGGVTDYVFEYDDVNKQFGTKITGPETAAGRRVEDLTHNRQGLLVRQIVNGRTEMEVRYDTGSRAQIRTNARGFATRSVKNEFEQITQIDYPNGSNVKQSYSALHLGMTEHTDGLGIKTQLQYDGKGNLLKKIAAAGTADQRITEYVVNPLGKTTQVTQKGRTEANGTVTPDAVWLIEYDAQGLIKKTTDPEGNIRQYVYNRAGYLIQYTDPRQNSTNYTVDADGNLLQVIDALGNQQTYAYDKVGNLISYRDARGKAIQAAYDALNRNVRTTNQVGGVYQTKYDAQSQPIEEIDEDGRRSVSEFDNFLRISRQIDALGNVTQYGYQISNGSSTGTAGSLYSPTEIKYPTFTQQQRYDQLEQPTTQTVLNPSLQGTEGLIDSTEYDLRGQIKSSTDANGKTRFYRHNALGQLTEITDSLGNKTTSAYDARGNLIQITDQNGRVSRFEYDRNNRVVKDILPMGQATQYAYDVAGNLIQRTDANGHISRLTYDELDRLIEVKQYRNGSQLQRSSSYTWDAESNLLSWSDTDLTRPTGQQTTTGTLSYDDASRKISETVNYPTPNGAAFSLNFQYGYSPAGNKTRLTWPDGTAIDYAYSAHDVLETITIPGEGSISVNQFKWLAPAKVTLPGGVTQENTLDGIFNLEGLKVKTAGQQTLLNLSNRFGKVQELKTSQRTDSSSSGSSNKTSNFSYDAETRLTQVESDSGSLFGTSTENFTLDAVGNRIAHSQVSGTWTYDANNRLLQRGTGSNATTYSYDEVGNLTQQIEPGNRVTQYRYDTQNRLVAVLDGNQQLIAEYGYDPLDRRLWKNQYRDLDRQLLAQAKRTYYLYADEGLIAEAEQAINTDGSVSNGLAPAMVTQYGPMPNSEFSTGVLFIKTSNSNGQPIVAYYHRDELDKPLQATDKNGNIVWAANYDAFGKASITTPAASAEKPTITSNLRLPGQYADAETGLLYNYRRYYDSSIGRYITMDPIGLAGGVNQYRYADADPVNRIDPTGEVAFLVPAAVAAARAYATCVASCMLEETATNAAMGECQNLGGSAKDCALGCLLGPLGKVGKWAKKAWDALPCAINSFPGETLVHVKPAKAKAQDAQLGKAVLKPISQLQIGDEVLAQSDWKDQGQSAKRDLRLSYEKITDVFTSQKPQTLIHLTLDSGERITATDGHPFKTLDGWRDAVLLKKGGQLLLKGGDADPAAERLATIVDIASEQQTLPVFNLEVANAHTFFVGEEGALVHNCKKIRWHDHHIVYQKVFQSWSKTNQAIIKESQDILKKYGIDHITDPINRARAINGNGTHTVDAATKVRDRLVEGAKRGREGVEEALTKIKEILEDGKRL